MEPREYLALMNFYDSHKKEEVKKETFFGPRKKRIVLRIFFCCKKTDLIPLTTGHGRPAFSCEKLGLQMWNHTRAVLHLLHVLGQHMLRQ
jgi:hypothetical protein